MSKSAKEIHDINTMVRRFSIDLNTDWKLEHAKAIRDVQMAREDKDNIIKILIAIINNTTHMKKVAVTMQDLLDAENYHLIVHSSQNGMHFEYEIQKKG